MKTTIKILDFNEFTKKRLSENAIRSIVNDILSAVTGLLANQNLTFRVVFSETKDNQGINCFLADDGTALENMQNEKIAAICKKKDHPEFRNASLTTKIIEITLQAVNKLMEIEGLSFCFAYHPDERDLDYWYCRLDESRLSASNLKSEILYRLDTSGKTEKEKLNIIGEIWDILLERVKANQRNTL